MCSRCQAVPKTADERVLSLCLSLECVSQQTLTRCLQHFEKKNKPPRFKEAIIKRAEELLEEQQDSSLGEKSIEFPSSVMNFEISDESIEVVKTVTAHIIGKGPKQESDDANATLGKRKRTYHRAQWKVGDDISEDQYEANKDQKGDIHIWFRWLNNQWTWSCISSSKFNQLRAVEEGRLSL